MLAGIHALVRAAVRGVQISRRADIRQTLRIALEREALPDELLAEIAGLERIIGMGSFAGYLIEKADILVAAGEQPEIVTLTKMFLGKHALEDGPFRCQFPDVWCVKPAAEDLLKILVLLDHDDDVVIHRQRRRPRKSIGRRRDAGRTRHESNDAQLQRFRHLSSRAPSIQTGRIRGTSHCMTISALQRLCYHSTAALAGLSDRRWCKTAESWRSVWSQCPPSGCIFASGFRGVVPPRC